MSRLHACITAAYWANAGARLAERARELKTMFSFSRTLAESHCHDLLYISLATLFLGCLRTVGMGCFI